MIDRALAHRRKLFMRPDAWRYLKPGAEGYDPPPGIGYREPAHYRAAREAREAAEAKAAQAQAERDEIVFSYELAALRFELALVKAALRVRRAQRLRLAAKAGFDPNQPRVPAGSLDGGQWTDGSGGGGESTTGGPTVQSILDLARQFAANGYSPSYLRCLDICSPILERPRLGGSDRNQWDFIRCMNACLGKNR